MEDRIQSYVDSGYFEQYGHIFYPYVGGSSYAPPPPPGGGVFGVHPGFDGGAGSSHEPHGPFETDQLASRISEALFAPPHGMSSMTLSLSNPFLDINPTSLEITTLPENAYVISNLWLDIHGWSGHSPTGGSGNGGGNGQ